jgi:hypothetical protein
MGHLLPTTARNFRMPRIRSERPAFEARSGSRAGRPEAGGAPVVHDRHVRVGRGLRRRPRRDVDDDRLRERGGR